MPVFALTTVQSPFDPGLSTGQNYDIWGSVTINGIQYRSPEDGFFAIKGAERAFRWDIQNAPITIGATERFLGRTPPPFTLEMNFWAASQWLAFLEIIQPFNYDPTILSFSATIRAVTIFHPALDAININQVICEGIVAPEQASDDHLWKASLKLREYFPPIKYPPQDKDSPPQQPTDPTSAETQNLQLQNQQLASKFITTSQQTFSQLQSLK